MDCGAHPVQIGEPEASEGGKEGMLGIRYNTSSAAAGMNSRGEGGACTIYMSGAI